jgi:hypothetical protein
MLESAVETIFDRHVRDLGGLSFKFAPLHKGNPDRLVLLHGRTYLVELKTDNGSLSPAQRLWHRRARECGVHVYVVAGANEARSWTPGQE